MITYSNNFFSQWVREKENGKRKKQCYFTNYIFHLCCIVALVESIFLFKQLHFEAVAWQKSKANIESETKLGMPGGQPGSPNGSCSISDSSSLASHTPLKLQVGVGNQGGQSELKLKLPPQSLVVRAPIAWG